MRRRPSSLFEVAADLRAMLEAIDAELPDEGVRSIERTRQLSCDGAGELAAAPSARKRARSPSPSAVRAAPAAADPGVLAAHTAAAPAVAAPVAVMLAPAARAAAAPASALARRRARLDEPAVRATFACQAPVGRPRTIRNRRLAAPLEELALVYKKAPRNRQDQFRAQVFGKAAKALLGWRAEIETADDLDELFAHHSALAARVSARKAPRCVLAPDGKVASVLRELVAAPRGRERAACRRLTSLLEEQDARARTVLLFSTIWGVGPSTAGEWYARGLKSIDDVRREAERLAPAVAVGLRCIEDFAKRIPRAEVELIKARVRAALVQLVGEGCIVFCDAVGSYRRGRADSGDADILICVNARAGGAADAAGESGSQDSSQRAERAGATRGVLSALVARLRGCGFITDTLAHPTDRNGKGSWMGVCRLGAQSPHRRLDMKVYPKALLPYATLYFTGSDYFNRSMRHFAKLKGYSLSDNGLSRRARDVPAVRPCATERDIFERLGLEWREPADRELAVVPVAEADEVKASHFVLFEDADERGARASSQPREADADADSDEEYRAVAAVLQRQPRERDDEVARRGDGGGPSS